MTSATVTTSTLEQLIRHAEKFGPDCVVETARTSYLAPAELAVLELEIAQLGSKNVKPAARRRRTSGGLRDQVLALRSRGLVVAAIADTLNISDRRVAGILNNGDTPSGGGQKRLVQATLFAD